MTTDEVEMVRIAQRCIGESLDRARAVSIELTNEDGDQSIQLPTSALRFIGELFAALSENGGVTVVSRSKELRTMQAANYLNVSRPFVIRELEAGLIPHRKVGSHRRIQFEDLHSYKEKMIAQRKDALKSLSEDAAELGLDY